MDCLVENVSPLKINVFLKFQINGQVNYRNECEVISLSRVKFSLVNSEINHMIVSAVFSVCGV